MPLSVRNFSFFFSREKSDIRPLKRQCTRADTSKIQSSLLFLVEFSFSILFFFFDLQMEIRADLMDAHMYAFKRFEVFLFYFKWFLVDSAYPLCSNVH